MSWTGFDWTGEYPRFVVDLTGDGRADILGFGFDGVWVALNKGDGTFAPPKRVLRAYGTTDGWHVASHVRLLADLTGDGRPDIVGFGTDYVWTALGNGDGTFQPPVPSFGGFSFNQGWRVDQHPRFLADLTGDGRADIVGFGGDGVYVALSDGAGGFQLAAGIAGFCYDQGWRVDQHPRLLADLTGDGRADIVGFANEGVYAALSDGAGGFQLAAGFAGFGWDQGWRVDQHPRFLADLTGDGRADIVGFGGDGVYAALSDGAGGFQLAAGVGDFGPNQGWRVDRHPRLVADLTGDGRADLIGLGDDYVLTALGNGDGSFQSPGVGAKAFGYNDGWRVDQHPRLLADLTGDGRTDIVGFGNQGVWTALGLGNGSFQPATATLALEDFGAQSGNTGVLPVKHAVISLDRLHCHKDGEIGAAEPYLLVAFFKVDGETNTIGVDNGQFAIVGPCTFRGTAGTHGNLGDTTVHDGDDVPIPPELGRFEFDLKPITAADLGLPDTSVGGFCGVVVALVEENWIAEDGAESGHRAFDRTLERLINETLPKLRQDMPDPLPPGVLEKLKDEVAHRIKAAVIGTEVPTFFGIFRLFNADVLIGADLFVADQPREIHARLQRTVTVRPAPGPGFPPLPDQQLLTHDYELFGSIAVEVTDAVPPLGKGQGTWEVQQHWS